MAQDFILGRSLKSDCSKNYVFQNGNRNTKNPNNLLWKMALTKTHSKQITLKLNLNVCLSAAFIPFAQETLSYSFLSQAIYDIEFGTICILSFLNHSDFSYYQYDCRMYLCHWLVKSNILTYQNSQIEKDNQITLKQHTETPFDCQS